VERAGEAEVHGAFPRPVRLLGWTSFFTDAASEAIYPLLPVFLTRSLGGSAVALGIIEGAADATSSLLKLVAGRLSDRAGRRKPFVVAGYGLASAARPLIAFATTWSHVLAIRLTDRVGKGLRSAPRDAMLGALAPEGQRGRVFGYHRAMDHAGAVAGPIAAAVFLWFSPGDYRTLFALTIIPGALAVALVLRVPEVNDPSSASIRSVPALDTTARVLTPPLRRFLLILALFTFGNSTDAFLLLHLSNAGLPTTYVPLAWAALHVIKSGLSTHGGALSDRFGRRQLIACGWLVYAAVYAGFAWSTSLLALITWFLVYGVHFALVEGSEKALVADLSGPATRGAAFGWYHAVLGVGALAASVLFGVVWETFGAPAAFMMGAGVAVGAAFLLLTLPTHTDSAHSTDTSRRLH
jgi:MFS family permease